MKIQYSLSLMVAAAAMFITSSPLRASESDDRIESSARQSYVFKTYLKNDAIHIKSKDGAVTLTGTVATEPHETLAEDTVSGLSGVKSVDNRLEIKGERPAKTSDAWLTTKVKTTLLFHRNVSATDTQVSVKEGHVTLRGKASSQAQKELTTEYVKDVEGVKDVRNKMSVSKNLKIPGEMTGEIIDDASITAQVKMTLVSHRSTSASNTQVETNEGVVTLSGKARNSAEKDLAAKLVTDIYGVKSVVNNMTIDESISKNN
ncbi:MAG: BON domain-containing protein [Nitrospiria bacterium]